jgi:hypothetical protein
MKHFARVTTVTGKDPMDLPSLLPLIVFLVLLAVLGMATQAWGVDSRSHLSNDHNR